ncbi:MAG: 1-acyl-sn-glycerol-3-phosphate acyltransferase [Pseudomonadota bacterium]
MVSIPVWAFVALCVFAAWAALDRVFLPGLRWLLRRRVNRIIEELNASLALRLEPMRLTGRQVLIDRLLYDEEVQTAALAHAREHGMRHDEVMAEVGTYAREIVPGFNAYAYFRIGYLLVRSVARALYRVRLGAARDGDLRAIPDGACVVFVMNHRSNMDYLLVAYLAATRSALSFAVGEWARVWPLQTLLRALGAYFIRRGSGNDLYRKVLARYVSMATAAGLTQAMYPEGGLSKTGALQSARLGLLAYMVRGFKVRTAELAAAQERAQPFDVVFIPVGINYDRVLEDRTLLALRDRTERAPPPVAGLLGLMRFLGNQMWLAVTGRWYRFGYAGVGFGQPVSLSRYSAEQGVDWHDEARFREQVESLGNHLLDAVGNVVPVLPVALTAKVMLDAERPLDVLEVKNRIVALIEHLEAGGVHVHVPRADRDYAVNVGIRMLELRRMIANVGGLLEAVPAEADLLGYYAASIDHYFAGQSAGGADE